MTAEAKRGIKYIFGNVEDSSDKLAKVKEAVLEGFLHAKKLTLVVQAAKLHGNVTYKKRCFNMQSLIQTF